MASQLHKDAWLPGKSYSAMSIQEDYLDIINNLTDGYLICYKAKTCIEDSLVLTVESNGESILVKIVKNIDENIQIPLVAIPNGFNGIVIYSIEEDLIIPMTLQFLLWIIQFCKYSWESTIELNSTKDIISVMNGQLSYFNSVDSKLVLKAIDKLRLLNDNNLITSEFTGKK